jgi:molecular chaperone DnaK (HSP70)
MGHKLGIDFGTTNSVIAHMLADTATSESQARAEIIALGDLSVSASKEHPVAVVPSLVYVHDAKGGKTTCGNLVRANSLDRQQDHRLFRNFKRGIVATPAPEPRQIDGVNYGDRDAGRAFVRTVIDRLPYKISEIDQLVLTAPVASFEGYLAWLNEAVQAIPAEKIRIVDESTAAALGYAVTKPGAAVLVFDFGGGTLDLSLVQLPESREKTGGFLERLRRGHAAQHTAKVVAKAGRIIGGSDIDQWLLADVLKRTNLTAEKLGEYYAPLLTLCEDAKIRLSNVESTEIAFHSTLQEHRVTYTRAELEALLEANGFYTALRRVVDKVMHVARQKGIFKEDIHYVLMVGGTSLMPSVQRTLGQYFSDMAVRADKPFTAVAEGALQVAAGYGLRHLSEEGQHQYDEIIPMGSRYPSEAPIEVLLSAAHDGQKEVEFVIGEIDTEAVSMVKVQYENGQAMFVAEAGNHQRQIEPLNEAEAIKMLAKLEPAGKVGEERLKAAFRIDERRQLRVTVSDIKTKKELIKDVVMWTLR